MIYKPQIDNQNFVYPNYDLSEYDVNIIHNPNDYSVSGNVTTFSATTVSSTSITITYSGTWILNNAQSFYINGFTNYLSIHAMAPNQDYYKPWRLIGFKSQAGTPSTVNFSVSTTFLPVNLGLTSFTTGTYYFEIRFIGSNSIFPVCKTLSITVP